MTTANWNEVFDTISLIEGLLGNSFTIPSVAISTKGTGVITSNDINLLSMFPTITRDYIKRVYHNQDKKTGQWHTTVSWIDGTKTTVACQEGDTPDKEKGLAMCICKKLFGNKSSYNEIFKEFCKDD